MSREVPLDEGPTGWNGVRRVEPFVTRPAASTTPYCDRCDLPVYGCRCAVDAPSALRHLRAIVAAGHSVPPGIEVPRQLWDELAAAEDYLLKFHPEE